MSRPLRIEFPGALYHVTSRGDRREAIFDDDLDRQAFMDTTGAALDRYEGCALAYCLMGDHHHLVLQTQRANLSLLMRHINGVYTQVYNRRHQKSGHLFQGRFKAILIDRDAYLLAVCRYPADWLGSSYRAHVGSEVAPVWLDRASLSMGPCWGTTSTTTGIPGGLPCAMPGWSRKAKTYGFGMTPSSSKSTWG